MHSTFGGDFNLAVILSSMHTNTNIVTTCIMIISQLVYTQYQPLCQTILCSNSPNLMFAKYTMYMILLNNITKVND